MSTQHNFSIPFDKIREAILGTDYDLSLVFANKQLSHELNSKYRGKDKPTNVLSFPLSDTSGEIFLDLETIKDEAPDFEMSYEEFVLFLFIHGLLHLKGMEHGDTMESEEKELFKSWRATLQQV